MRAGHEIPERPNILDVMAPLSERLLKPERSPVFSPYISNRRIRPFHGGLKENAVVGSALSRIF